VTRIAVHEALLRVRRRQRDRPGGRSDGEGDGPVARLAAPGPSPEEQAHAERVRLLLEAAIDGLPRRYRSVFVLREVEGLTTAETALCLGIRPDAVKTRLSRARALLRSNLRLRTGGATADAFRFGLARCDRIVARVLATVVQGPRPVH
jgi:RNA polymerase sigma-70 factor (ECF subfamily)